MTLPFNVPAITVPLWLLIMLGFILAIVFTYFTIPSIVNISKLKGLSDNPNGRTSHTSATPTLGGIAVFIGLVLSTVVFAGEYFDFELKYIITGLIIISFIGIKDDILIIDPMKKFAGQILAVVLVVVFADIRITNLHGLFSIEQLPYIASILLTIFVFIVIMNGFNLIDGIDGLASGVGILTATVFGILFWISGNTAYSVFSFSFVGTLSVFFCFNVFGEKNKIFLGDTGSLVIGFVMGILACRFLQLELPAAGAAFVQSAPAVVSGILIVPLFDTLRVFTLRVIHGKSPFKADRQHLHHRLLQLGKTHLQATLILISVNLFFIVLSFLLQGIGIIWLAGVILGLASLMSFILVTLVKKSTANEVVFEYFVAGILKRRGDNKRIIGVQGKRNIDVPSPRKVTAS